MKLNLLITLLLITNNLFSQIPSWDWAWSIGGNNVDQINFLQIDEEGNSYVCGNFRSSSISIGGLNYAANYSQPKSFFAKVSANGQLLWYKVYPANNQTSVTYILDLIEGYNNNYYVLMQYYGTLNLDGYILTNNFQQGRTLVVEYNAAGNVMSAYHFYDTTVNNNDLTTFFHSIVKHPRGGYAFLGFSSIETVLNGIEVPANSNYIGYMDTLGSVQEIHLLGGMGEMDTTYGDFPNQVVYRELKVSPKGNIYLAGEANINSYLTVDTTTWQLPEISCTSPNTCMVRTFIACFDSTFSFKWSKVGVLNENAPKNTYGANYGGIHVFPDESVIISQNASGESELLFDSVSSGPRATPTTYADGIVAKISGEGTVLWVKRFDSSDHTNNAINATTGDGLGNSYLLMYSGEYQNTDGSVYTNAVVSKVDVNGNVQWYKGTDNGADGGIYFYVLGFKDDGKGNVYLAGGFSCYQAQLPNFNGNILPWYTPVYQYPYAFDAFIAKLNNCSSLPVDIVSNENQTFCNEDSAFVEVSGGPNFLWSDGDSSQSRFINESGIYTVLSYNNAGCYGNRDTLSLTKLDKIAYEQSVQICQGETFNIGTQLFNQSGVYQSTLTAQNGCDSLVTTHLTVDSLDVQISLNQNVFSAVNIPVDATYQWLDCESNLTALIGQINPTYTATENGIYALEINTENCRDTSECLAFSNVGIQDAEDNSILLFYPNPVQDVLTISFKNNETYQGELSMYDTDGKLVYSTKLLIGKLDVSQLARGVYTLRFKNGSNTEYHRLSKI